MKKNGFPKNPGDNLIETVKNIVNTSNLNIMDDDDLINIMKILNFNIDIV